MALTRSAPVLLAALLYGATAQPLAEVQVLTSHNFDDIIEQNRGTLVMFYAPWCGHCKKVMPVFEKAALLLVQKVGPEDTLRLAKVDATAETALADKHGVRGYPTLKYYSEKAKGKTEPSREYDGGRTEDAFVTWILKAAGPATEMLDSADAVTRFKDEHSMACVVFADAEAREPFETVARNVNDVMFGAAPPSAAAAFDVEPGSIVFFFPHDAKKAVLPPDKSGRIVASEVENLLKKWRLPLVVPFSGEISERIFEDGRPLLFLFRDPILAEHLAPEQAFRAVAPDMPDLLLSVVGPVEPMDQRLMEFLAVGHDELPTVRYVTDALTIKKKYKFEGEWTAAALKDFVSNVEAGSLRPHLQSQPAPESNPGPLLTVVGNTFHSIVMDPTKDVLVEFHAPWCGHCKKLEPVMKELARKYENNPRVVVAQIDSTANDVEEMDIIGLPTLKLFKAEEKDKPKDYEGGRDVASLTAWLDENTQATRVEL